MRLRKGGGLVGAGARDTWVTIQARPDESDSDSGFPIDAPWTDLATVAMLREDLDADEIQRSAQQVAISTTRWEMPYLPEMDPAIVDVPKLRRLIYYGRAYDIISATPIGRAGISIVTEAYANTAVEAVAR